MNLAISKLSAELREDKIAASSTLLTTVTLQDHLRSLRHTDTKSENMAVEKG